MRETVTDKVNALEIDLQELLVAYLRRWWLLVMCLAIGAAISFGGTLKFVTPKYQAKISIYVSNSRVIDNADYLTSSDLSAAQRLVNTYVSIAKSDRVLSKISNALNGEYSASQLNGMIRASQMNETEIFCIYVVHEDPVEASRIANAAAEVAPKEISNLIEGTSAHVIDTAKVPTSRHSPNYSKAAFVGGLIGLVLAVAFVTITFLQDTRIKDENDLTGLVDLPVLGRIPNFEVISSGGTYGYYSLEEKKEATK